MSESFFAQNSYKDLELLITKKSYSSVFVLVDTNTRTHCLPLFQNKVTFENKIEVIHVANGEASKTIETCVAIWKQLMDKGADRKSVIINLGGGMITDLGGFVASTYKRGIPFINVPTTLLGMVDASIGGKNGVDFHGAKNQIGTIHQPEMVVLDAEFLITLPSREIRSGMAEMYKHALIKNISAWEEIRKITEIQLNLKNILASIKIKEDIVAQDPLEKNLRKTLNYGHTLGHAIEAYFLQHKPEPLLHGEAIAIGLILETYLSVKILGLDKDVLKQVSKTIFSHFAPIEFSEEDIHEIINLLIYDKKNENGKVLFVLLKNIGDAVTDITVENYLIAESFTYYKNFIKL